MASYGLGRAVMTRQALTSTSGSPFADPSPIAATVYTGFEATPTTGSITVTQGQRIVVCGAHSRGNPPDPDKPPCTLTSVSGNGDFSGWTWTVHEDATHEETGAEQYGGNSWVASLVAPGNGTGTVSANYDLATWQSIIQPFVLQPCTLHDSDQATMGVSEGTTLDIVLNSVPDANDLAICALASEAGSPNVVQPTGFTETGSEAGSGRSFSLSWKNGSVVQTNTGTGYYNLPGSGVIAVFRRSE